MKRVKDYMNRDVTSFGPHDSLFDVADVLSKHRISGAPVVDGRKVIGIITISDIMKFLKVKLPGPGIISHEEHSISLMLANFLKQEIDIRLEMRKISNSMVKDFMSKDVVFIDPEATLIEAAEVIERNKVDRLPVINENERLLGILSQTDLLKAMLE